MGSKKMLTQLTAHDMVNHTLLFLHTSQKPQHIGQHEAYFL